MAKAEWGSGKYLWAGSGPHHRVGADGQDELVHVGDLFTPSEAELGAFSDLMYSQAQWEAALSEFIAAETTAQRQKQLAAERQAAARPGERAPENRPQDALERTGQVERMRQRESDKQIRAKFGGGK